MIPPTLLFASKIKKPHRALFAANESRLYQPRLLQRLVSAVLLDGLQGAGGDGEDHGLLQFRDVDALFLQVGVAAHRAGRIELGGAGAVGISAAHTGPDFSYSAYFCHVFR